MLLLGSSEGVVDVVGDFGEASECGDVRILPELLSQTARGVSSLRRQKVPSAHVSYLNQAEALVVQKVLERLRQSLVGGGHQKTPIITWTPAHTHTLTRQYQMDDG